MSELLDAIKNFQNTVQEVQVTSAFRDATGQFKQIAAQEQDLFKRRQAEEEFAKNFSQQLLGMGASPQQVAQGFQAYMPQAMTKSQDFFSAAANEPSEKNRQAYIQRGKELQRQEGAMNQYQQESIKLGWAGLMGQQQAAQQAGKELSAKEADKVDEATYRYKSLKENAAKLDTLINDTGTFEAFGPEAEKMDKIIQDMAVDYAKMVDPESVAREGEVEAAKKYTLPIRSWGGLGMSNSTAKTLIQDYMTSLDDRMRNQLLSKKGMTQKTPLPRSSKEIDFLNQNLEKAIQNNAPSEEIERLRKVIERAKALQGYPRG